MNLFIKGGTTSKLTRVFIKDSTSTSGAGLTGLVYNSAGLAAYYIREGSSSPTSITLVNATIGTWASGGFKEVSSSNMPGVYEVGLPNAVLDTGVGSVYVMLRGATNMIPLVMEIQIVAFDPSDSARLGLTSVPNANPGSAGGLLIAGTNAAVEFVGSGVPGIYVDGGSGAGMVIQSSGDSGIKFYAGPGYPAIYADQGIQVDYITALVSSGLATGTIVSATANTTLLDGAASDVSGYYVGARLRIASGTGAGQERIITEYTAGHVATHADWKVIPDGTSEYFVEPARASLAADSTGSNLIFSGAAGASEIAICNMALSHLGVGKEISNLETEKGEEAAACRRFFATARDNTLRDYPWPFATKIISLALVEEDPNEEWSFSYRYPTDCVRARRILSGQRNDNRQTRVPYVVAQDETGLLIYTDSENAELEYTFRDTDPSRYPGDYVMALSLRLASYIAPRLTKGDPFKLGERALQLHQLESMKAMQSAHVEEQNEETPASEFERSRE
jgi:hypothetical protein